MYFANVAFIRDYIAKMVAEFSEAAATDTSATTGRSRNASEASATRNVEMGAAIDGGWTGPEPIRYIVMEMTPVMSIDSTAVHMLEDMHRDLKQRGIHLAFSTVGNRVEDTLKRAGLIDKMGERWIHPSVHSAVQHCILHRTSLTLSDDASEAPAQFTTATSASKNGGNNSPTYVSAAVEMEAGAAHAAAQRA